MYIGVNKKSVKRLGMMLVVGILVVSGVLVSKEFVAQEVTPTSADGNWGLSFQQEGATPVGNATAEYLRKYDSYFVADGNKKEIFLTFDAGYENGYTEQILDVLKKEKVPATFFVVGNYIKDNPKLIKRMVKDGHIVGNHTMTHPNMSAIADFDAFKAELTGVETLYKDTTSKKMLNFYRPPQGKYSEENLKQAKELGYITVFWSLAYVDWLVDSQPTREEAMGKLLPRIHNGTILLLHTTSKTNAQILGELINTWKKDGYVFSSLNKLGSL